MILVIGGMSLILSFTPSLVELGMPNQFMVRKGGRALRCGEDSRVIDQKSEEARKVRGKF
jgi:hypothetical protein